MWLQYQKTVVPTQLFIVALCLALYWRGRFPLPIVGVFFGVMQLGAVVGAWWAMRLRRRIEKARERLPLQR